MMVGGSLYTIHIEDMLCRKADFKTEVSTPHPTPQTLYMFVARDEPLYVDSHRREVLVSVRHTCSSWCRLRPRWSRTGSVHSNLIRNMITIAGEELSRGVVPLSQDTNDSKLLERVTQLCGALKPTSI